MKNHSENWTKDITFGFFGGFFACFFVVVVIVCLFVFLGWFSFLVLLLWTFSEDMLWLSFLRRLVLCGVLYLHCFAVFELIVIKNSMFILNIEKFTNKEKEHFQIFKKIKSRRDLAGIIYESTWWHRSWITWILRRIKWSIFSIVLLCTIL